MQWNCFSFRHLIRTIQNESVQATTITIMRTTFIHHWFLAQRTTLLEISSRRQRWLSILFGNEPKKALTFGSTVDIHWIEIYLSISITVYYIAIVHDFMYDPKYAVNFHLNCNMLHIHLWIWNGEALNRLSYRTFGRQPI